VKVKLLTPVLALFLVTLLVKASPVDATETVLIQSPSGTDLEVIQYQADSRQIMLWLPSERGMRPNTKTYARDLANMGIETWLVDLHQSYFLEPGRNSLVDIPIDDIIFLIDQIKLELNREVVLLTGQRGAQLALISARQWQLDNPGLSGIKGMILFHPNLYRETPVAGDKAEYLPITKLTNLPIYLVNTEFSTKSLRRKELVEELQRGGSQVYSHWLKGVQGGFYAKPDDELGAADRDARSRLASLLKRSLRLLVTSRTPVNAVASDIKFQQLSVYQPQDMAHPLRPMKLKAPQFTLQSMDGKRILLEQFNNQVVLVNFWASWCAPCVEEIPSISRLIEKMSAKSFKVISINIGEDRERIEKFSSQVPIDFPILLDQQGEAAKDWNVYVYPSSFIVDKNGIIRFAYSGGLDWDKPQVIWQIHQLVAEI
jgi:thiol-disulfide isomerase/thioredoxin